MVTTENALNLKISVVHHYVIAIAVFLENSENNSKIDRLD